MGLFDVFTGDPAKEAAAKNTALLQQNQATGTGTLQNGQNSAIGALGQSAGLYGSLASKYAPATSLGLDALGVNGAAGNDRATSAFHAGPGYQYSVDQALQNTLRTNNAQGQGVAGNTLAALSDRAGNMADQNYNSWVSNLNGYVNPELSATNGQAGAIAQQAPVYTGTANNIANLGTNTTNGIAGQNTQAANAQMQANGNMWNAGMQAATALATGGTSLLGGGGGGKINLGGPGGPTPFS